MGKNHLQPKTVSNRTTIRTLHDITPVNLIVFNDLCYQKTYTYAVITAILLSLSFYRPNVIVQYTNSLRQN